VFLFQGNYVIENGITAGKQGNQLVINLVDFVAQGSQRIISSHLLYPWFQ
jgi:hypothetical protein